MHYMNGIASELHTYGGLLLGARLRRLSDQLYAATDEIYREHGVTIPSGAVALLLLLRDQNRALSIGEVARRMGQSHVAISRVTRALSRAGVIGETGDARDQRVVMLMLLPRGRALLERLQPTHDAMVAAVEQIAGAGALLRAVRALEEGLEERDFAARVRGQKNKRRNRSRAV